MHLPSRSARAAAAPRPEPAISVVLADDHRMVRRTLRLLLDRERGLEVIGEAGDPFTTLRLVKGHGPHVLLLDLRMPGGSSLELIQRLHREAPETAIVVVTMEDSPAFARRALDAGATAYVLKHHAVDDLPVAVRLAGRGIRYVSPRVAARLESHRRGVDGDGLTRRELDVLRLVALGMTTGEIAAELHRSRRTVESHVKHIRHRLGLVRRSELVRYALSHGLIDESTGTCPRGQLARLHARTHSPAAAIARAAQRESSTSASSSARVNSSPPSLSAR